MKLSNYMKNKPAIIVDLDGTLADLGNRNPYDASNCQQDKVNLILLTIAKLIATYEHEILIVTGRKEIFKKETEQWLRDNQVQYERLFMRTNDDDRTQTEFKEEVLAGIEKEYRVILAFEDSWRVAEMYRAHGIPCWQVNHDSYYG